MNQVSQVKCKRCGICCWIYNFRHNDWYPCRYLRFSKEKTFTYCKIYNRRIGISTGENQLCGQRVNFLWDIPGCPYNTGKPLHPMFK